jgi:hypothetical protein
MPQRRDDRRVAALGPSDQVGQLLPAAGRLNAIKTRIAYMQLQVSDLEIRALMRKVSSAGYESLGKMLPPAACSEVCEYVIKQSLAMHRQLDMRMLINSFEDRLLWEEGNANCHWRDLVNSRVRERPTYFHEDVTFSSQSDRRNEELEIVRDILSATSDRNERRKMWEERTGKSEPTLYRRIADLKGEGEFSIDNVENDNN